MKYLFEMFFIGIIIGAVAMYFIADYLNKESRQQAILEYSKMEKERYEYVENFKRIHGLDTMSITQRRDWLESRTRKDKTDSGKARQRQGLR